MITLYSGSGSGGFELGVRAGDLGSFQNLKGHVAAILNTRGSSRSVELLSMFPFELFRGSNDFNDDFELLHATLPLDRYESARLQKDSPTDRAAYAKIAEAFTEIGSYVRFIAVTLDTSKRPPFDPRGLKDLQIKKLVQKYIGVEGGYLGDFSYRSHAEFYTDLELDIDPNKYSGTTRERFMQILSQSTPDIQATILDGILSRFAVGSNEKRTPALADEIRGWAVSLRSGAVPHPKPANTTDTVRRALADAEYLLQKNGPASAVDRVHTALHGYQLGLCSDERISLPPDASLTQVFKALRKSHPAFSSPSHRSQDLEKILNALASILDAMNPIRNQASVAHPNEVLLDDAEARLVLNASSTLFHYLESKINSWRKDAREEAPKVDDDDVPF